MPGHRAGSRVQEVRIGTAPLELDRIYTIAVPDFLFHGGDGYTMFAGQNVLSPPVSGTLLATALEKHIAGVDVASAVQGRMVMAQ